MPVHCADCDASFLLSPDGETVKAACPHCGGTRLERDQPSPTHSDGELRNMVDPGIGLDQGGNPLQEGVWATTDGGWQPLQRRDESFASVRTAMDFDFGDGGFDFSEKNPTHKFIIDQSGKVYSAPNPVTHEQIADAHRLHDLGFPHKMSLGELNSDNSTDWYQHDTPHSAQAMESMLYGHFGTPVQIDPSLKPTTNEERFGIDPATLNGGPQRELDRLYGPASPRSWGVPRENEGLVRGGSALDNVIPQDPYLPWWVESSVKEADVPPAPAAPQAPAGPQHSAQVTPGPLGIHAGTLKWLQFLDAHLNGEPVRQNAGQMFGRYGMPNSPEFRQPVTVSVHHPEHLPGAIETIETSAEGHRPAPSLKEVALRISQGQVPPPPGIDPSKLRFGSVKVAFLPLLGLGAAALGEAVLPSLMRGALMGTGSHMVQGLLGGGAGDAAGQLPSMPPARGVEQLAKVAEVDLRGLSNPGYHDSPDGDTKQFEDQSTDTAFQNPNRDAEAGGSADGEDNVGAGIGPQFSEHALERANLLLPLIMHHYHSPDSGANDALLRELHEQLEGEVPGYLDHADDAQAQDFIKKLREPSAVAASTKHSIMNPYQGPGGGFQDSWGDNRDVNPNMVQFAPGAGQGRCPYCGGVQTADGSCPQCGAKVGPQGGAIPAGQAPGTQQSVPPPGWQNQLRAAGEHTAADHQGPVTDEQKAAVAELLNQTGRHEEIPAMLREPWNYAKELAAVADKVNTAPNVDPSEQPPAPPEMPVAPNGGLPPGMPNPADPSMMPQASVKESTPHGSAPRCPKCKSATTGFIHNGVNEFHGECHSCGNVWPVGDASVVRTSADDNPVAVPAADQEAQYDAEKDQDSSHSWQDDNGAPLVVGQTYEMHSPQYSIPDVVRVEQIKPDAIVVTTVGEYTNADPNSQFGDDEDQVVGYKHEIPLQEIQMEGITFTPSTGNDATDQTLDQSGPDTNAPVNTEPVEQPQTEEVRSHVEASEEIEVDDSCPKCAGQHIASQMSSPTTSFHECYRCGHAWETREEDYTDHNTASREWLNSDVGHGDDFFAEYERVKAMKNANGSRSLSDIAAKDSRLQEIRERLDANKKEAGRKFTPYEQREFIDEDGVARNSDKLDLAGTHYESNHRYIGERANGENAPDEHLFLGL